MGRALPIPSTPTTPSTSPCRHMTWREDRSGMWKDRNRNGFRILQDGQRTFSSSFEPEPQALEVIKGSDSENYLQVFWHVLVSI
jgi:hypothetical protein